MNSRATSQARNILTMKECQIEGTMAFAQRSAVEAALRDNRCNLSHAARQLRVGRTTLYRLIKRFEIEVEITPRPPLPRPRANAASQAPTSVRLVDGVWYLVRADGSRA
ncbi:helix-turn-helix domain-containing protein [Sphingomonas citri]